MRFSVEATFENGAFRPVKPVSLPEGTAVHLQVSRLDEAPVDPLDAAIGIGSSGRSDGAENHDKCIYGKIRP